MSDSFIIEVRVTGAVDSSLSSAASEAKSTLGTVGDQSTTMASAVSGALKAIGDDVGELGSAWQAFKTGAEIAGEALEQTAGKAEEFGLSNAKFAAQIGSTEEVAAGLSAALKGVGASTDEYAAMSGNLDRQVETNEKSM